jgi:metal-responsive CopG/Arc/MetJ family transcriptional regulator
MMKTIQMTVDEPLLAQVDKVIEGLDTTRSAFIRDALRYFLERHRIRELEKKHAEGYAQHPVEPGEFDIWETEQAWGNHETG